MRIVRATMAGEPINRADFEAYFRFSPAALAVREAVRLGEVRGIELAEPLLDVGCGDGLFASLAYPGKQVWGIDINPVEVKRAQATASYATLICGNVCTVDLPRAFFGGAIANCSLEHVPGLPAALANVRRSLQPGALFVLIVPTPEWSRHLGMAELLATAGLKRLAVAYGDALDRVFNHVHLHDDSWWSDQLHDAGFDTIESRRIVSRSTSWIFEALLPSSTLGWMVKRLTGRWIVAPSLRGPNSELTWNLVNRLYELFPDGTPEAAAEYLIVARCSERDPVAR
ncbi:MAG TPA: methyltransferase domain-containing protein [Kofleriaceae bacterium]|nr:methyltransferase domain-containing protein [Kofleriaceae bacterium]